METVYRFEPSCEFNLRGIEFINGAIYFTERHWGNVIDRWMRCLDVFVDYATKLMVPKTSELYQCAIKNDAGANRYLNHLLEQDCLRLDEYAAYKTLTAKELRKAIEDFGIVLPKRCDKQVLLHIAWEHRVDID